MDYQRFDVLPQLRFRTPSGRWATLLQLPGLDGSSIGGDWNELLFSFKLPEVISDLRRFQASDEDDSVDTEKDYGEARQRRLVDDVLRPHLGKWDINGLCLQDLNPSEFEDLVAELLFETGLKVYKVRESPQGGRDLIARGTLIPGEEPLEMAVEVKHRWVVDRPEVQLTLYQNRAYPALVFVTSGRFTAGVFKEKLIAENCRRPFLKDGVAIGDMVRFHFGIRNPERRFG